MLDAFIEAHCENNLSVLIISGEPDQAALSAAWNEIVFEYGTLIGPTEADAMFELSREIGILQSEIFYIDAAITVLRYRPVQEIIDELIAMGYEGAYDFNDRAAYERDLKRLVSLSKTKVFDLEGLIDQYNNLEKTSTGKKQSREDFLKTIHFVAQSQSYHINRKTTSVEDFAIMFSNYRQMMNIKLKEVEHGR
jgi:hypothetical protein